MNKYQKAKITTLEKYGADHYYQLGLKGGRKRVLKDKTCSTCEKSFRPKNSLTKFCSFDCAIKNRPKKGVNKVCICGKKFYLRQSNIRNNNFCSQECAYKSFIKGTDSICRLCKKEYHRSPSMIRLRGTKYCSVKCKGEALKMKYKKARTDRTKYPKGLAKFKKWTWKYFSDYIRERDNWTCFTCDKYDKSSAMHAGHFISRVRAATLFDEMNVHAQCYSCNIGKKGNAGEYSYRLIQKYGQEKFDDLVIKSRELHKFTYEELEEIYQNSKQLLKEVQS